MTSENVKVALQLGNEQRLEEFGGTSEERFVLLKKKHCGQLR